MSGSIDLIGWYVYLKRLVIPNDDFLVMSADSVITSGVSSVLVSSGIVTFVVTADGVFPILCNLRKISQTVMAVIQSVRTIVQPKIELWYHDFNWYDAKWRMFGNCISCKAAESPISALPQASRPFSVSS